jgi:hypothetical protein
LYTQSLSAAGVAHRESFRVFVVESAEPWHRQHLGRLYDRWSEWNEQFFSGSMIAPYILFSVTNHSRAFGDYSPISGFGGRGQIRIRESLLTGAHRAVRAGEEFAEGRYKFVEDVLLHETVHQYQYEVLGRPEKSFKGHGPVFRELCNRVGSRFGLTAVRVAKARGKLKTLPSCAHWPHCVRPGGHYAGAYVSEVLLERDDGGGDEEVGRSAFRADKLEIALGALTAAAQQYARAWAVGSEKEAAALFAGGKLRGGEVERKLAALCSAARDFSESLG